MRPHWTDFLAVRRDGHLIGLIELEAYASLVYGMPETARASWLTLAHVAHHRSPRYFERFGFVPVERDAVPPDVKQSVEFRGACPDPASVMMLAL